MKRAIRFTSLVLLTTSVCTGCRTPSWWAYRSMRCVPATADTSSSEFFEKCNSQDDLDSAEGLKNAFPTFPSTPLNQVPGTEAPKPPALNPPAVEPRPDSSASTSRPSVHLASSQSATSLVHLAERSSADSSTSLSSNTMQGDALQSPPKEQPSSNVMPLYAVRKASQAQPLDSDQISKNIEKFFPPFPPLPEEPDAMPDASLGRMTLDQLHQMARENHPSLRAAAARVEAARGQMIQVGLPPNPNMGYEADTVRTINTPGYHGAYFQQTFITAKKLGLAAQAAAVDYANSYIEQRKTWITIQSSVRRNYFQLLAARKRLVLTKALLNLSENTYQAHIKLVIGGEAAPYEPLQLRVLITQARAAVVRAQQDSIAAWRMLAANVGVPDLRPSAIEGAIDCAVPSIAYEDAVAMLIGVHTDLQTTQNLIAKNRTLVTLADRTVVPDLNVGFVLQRDYTFDPGTTTYNLQLGGAVPVWDRNQGNRIAARAELVRSIQTVTETQNRLIADLAKTYAVYQSNRQLAQSFRDDGLANQEAAYRGIYQRYLTDPAGISFNDVVTSQQTMAGVLYQYIDTLQAQWQSTVDLAELLQVDDVFLMGTLTEVAPVPDLQSVNEPIEEEQNPPAPETVK